MHVTVLRRAVAITAVGLVAASALLVGVAVARPDASPSFAVAPPAPPGITGPDGAIDAADGVLPSGGASVGNDEPGVANLDADLLTALRAAAADAEAAGIRIVITSGWRSSEYQQSLLTEAEGQYGSLSEAARWVATPETSLHVSGDAVDIGSYDAIEWLGEHGSRYGLCPVYENEPWHFERRPDAVTAGCPGTYRDPTQDPRLQQ